MSDNNDERLLKDICHVHGNMMRLQTGTAPGTMFDLLGLDLTDVDFSPSHDCVLLSSCEGLHRKILNAWSERMNGVVHDSFTPGRAGKLSSYELNNLRRHLRPQSRMLGDTLVFAAGLLLEDSSRIFYINIFLPRMGVEPGGKSGGKKARVEKLGRLCGEFWERPGDPVRTNELAHT